MGVDMNDYKELVSNLLFLAKYCHRNYNELFVDDELKKAAYAIEQLVKERDAAIADLTSIPNCEFCKRQNSELCKGCAYPHVRWEWRGVQEVNG